MQKRVLKLDRYVSDELRRQAACARLLSSFTSRYGVKRYRARYRNVRAIPARRCER